MYRLTRTSAEPASPLKIMIAKPDGVDAGLTAGGSFMFEPGDVVQVDPYVAGVIMGDPSLATHFECLPPWKVADAEPAQADAAPADAVPAEPERRSGHSRLTVREGKITPERR